MAKELTREQKDAKNLRAKELREQKKTGMADMDSSVKRMKETVIIDTSDVVVEISEIDENGPEPIEETPEIAEMAVTKIDREPVVRDGEVVEITGVIKDMWIEDEELNSGSITVKDTNGDEHEVSVRNKGNVWGLFYQADSKKYLNGMAPYEILEDCDRDDEIERIIEKEKTMVFRCIFGDDEHLELFAPVSLKYEKSKIEDLIPAIKDSLGVGNEDIVVTSSTGRWGGNALVKFNADEVSQFNVCVDGGILDGGHSITIRVGGMILSCSNQMVMEVQQIVRGLLPKFSFGTRSVHSGDIEGFKEKLEESMVEMVKFQELIEEAKDIPVTKLEVEKILEFYVKKGVLSDKTVTTISRTILDDRSIQQVPGTLWGLAMVLTYAGTHCNFKDGVKFALKKTGGELLCVSSVWEAYMELVETTIINDVKDEEEEEEDE